MSHGRRPRGRSVGVFRPGLCALAWFLVVACDDSATAPEGPRPVVVDEAGALLAVLIEDPAASGLEEVQDVVSRGLPVRAAGLLEVGVISAAERQVDRVQAVQLEEPEVVAQKRAAVAALEERVEALHGYREVLSRGRQEDLALVEAMGRLRASEFALLEVLEALNGLRGPPSAVTLD